jgi:hypothetical protein
MKMKNKFIIGQKYIFVFVGDGFIKSFETTYEKELLSNMYGHFDCGIDVRFAADINTEDIHFFNIVDSRLDCYVNCDLYIFSDKENVKKLLPAIVKSNLMDIKNKSEILLKEYMELADNCTSLENAIKLLKNNNFEPSKPFE